MPPLAPLEDPAYQPLHPPVDGRMPAVVTRWGPRSQLRWFARFRRHLGPREDVSAHWVDSPRHRGSCCPGCLTEQEEGRYYLDDDCCCREVEQWSS